MLIYVSNRTQYNIGREKKNTNNVESIVLIYFLLSDLSWKKKEHAKKTKKYRKREKKTKQTNTRAQRKHGQHIQNQGPKQTTRNVHAADKNVCE